MEKIHFLTDRKFPYGNAGGTRVLGMCKALASDYSLSVCSDIYEGQKNDIEMHNIHDIELHFRSELVGQSALFFYFVRPFLIVFQLYKSKTVQESDIVVIYTTNLIFFIFANLMFFKNQRIHDVVEWFSWKQYKFWFLNPRYIQYSVLKLLFKYYCKRTIAISDQISVLVSKVGGKNIKCANLPDKVFVPKNLLREKIDKFSKEIIFYYGGQPGKKESFHGLVEALNIIQKDLKKNIKIKLIGNTPPDLIDNFNKIKSKKVSIEAYGFLDRQEYIACILGSHFLILLREDTDFNRANYPLKVVEAIDHKIPIFGTCVGDYGERYRRTGLFNVHNVDSVSVSKALSKLDKMTNEEYKVLVESIESSSDAQGRFRREFKWLISS